MLVTLALTLAFLGTACNLLSGSRGYKAEVNTALLELGEELSTDGAVKPATLTRLRSLVSKYGKEHASDQSMISLQDLVGVIDEMMQTPVDRRGMMIETVRANKEQVEQALRNEASY